MTIENSNFFVFFEKTNNNSLVVMYFHEYEAWQFAFVNRKLWDNSIREQLRFPGICIFQYWPYFVREIIVLRVRCHIKQLETPLYWHRR